MTTYTAATLRTLGCRAAQPRLDAATIAAALSTMPGWTLSESADSIAKTYRFKDFHRTMAFVNAVAWIAHAQDHHPDLDVHYDRCGVTYSTHDTGGVTLNDLICAARVDALGA